MTPLTTILLIHIGADTYSMTYPSQMACGEALVVIAEATPAVGEPRIWAQCQRTYAPSQSIRPRARGDL
jgi:hypothetical protein